MAADPVLELLPQASQSLHTAFSALPAFEPALARASDGTAMAEVLEEVAGRLGDNYPYFHPLYAGQMLKPPHPVARAAYALAMTINPNNHARDGGRASSEMEIEAVREIAAMFGWTEFLGHLTSGGTMANLEALWVAGELNEGRGTKGSGTRGRKRIVASEQAHYTHSRISHVLKLQFGAVAADNRGRMRLDALEDELKKGDVGTVVATLGTTAMGAADPLDEILELREKYGFRVHVDAAYGGYFRLIQDELEEEARRAFAKIDQADSIVVDPHKHGLQPYGCGCILFKDPAMGRFYKHDSPYTYFTSKELHLGEISLECSRAGAAAVALWATQKLLPLTPGGEFAQGLAQGRRAALELDRRLRADGRFACLAGGKPELDIVVWALRAADSEAASASARQVFAAAAARALHLALVQLPQSWFGVSDGSGGSAVEYLTCLRSVLMKPEHESWLGAIWTRLQEACEEVLPPAAV
ncbi:MAG TPA: pyridoxal-dependent decarboxylase [Terracidiphilus sp.]|jgi:glutamate/tyrosine decarboxylase-like PLP-dependent enzyme|nr:pyridoxal-dependent decarboxylase [Terracidiphilus sp.]